MGKRIKNVSVINNKVYKGYRIHLKNSKIVIKIDVTENINNSINVFLYKTGDDDSSSDSSSDSRDRYDTWYDSDSNSDLSSGSSSDESLDTEFYDKFEMPQLSDLIGKKILKYKCYKNGIKLKFKHFILCMEAVATSDDEPLSLLHIKYNNKETITYV